MVPKYASVVIIGCGIMGISTAYNLAQKGVKDIVIIEKNTYVGGHTTTRCAGGFRFQYSDKTNIDLSIKSMNLIKGYDPAYKLLDDYISCGYLFLFSDEHKETMLQAKEIQNEMRIESEWFDRNRIQTLLPMMNADNIHGGTYYKGDGLINVSRLVNFYLTGARNNGVKIFTNTKVLGLETDNNHIKRVKTSKGDIHCDIVVNAAGPWASDIAEMIGITLPIKPTMQQLFVTNQVPWVNKEFPVIILVDDMLGVHQEGNGLITGLTRPDYDDKFSVKNVDRSWMLEHCRRLINRFPDLAHAQICSSWYGYYENTPDDYPIIGKIDETDNLYCIAGFSGHGIMHSPVASLVLSELIVENKTVTCSLKPFDYKRFKNKKVIRTELYKV